jgi:transposase-like protein
MRFPIDVVLVCVGWSAAYPLSYRHLEKMMNERGVSVDHSTINRCAIRFMPLVEMLSRKHRHKVGTSWRMDETYIKDKGAWKYLYRAVDKEGKTVDFLLTAYRGMAAARRFFEKALRENDVPEKIAMDKSGPTRLRSMRSTTRWLPRSPCGRSNTSTPSSSRPPGDQTRDHANAELQVLSRTDRCAGRRRSDALDSQGSIRDRQQRHVVRRSILCAGATNPSSVSRSHAMLEKIRRQLNNAAEPSRATNLIGFCQRQRLRVGRLRN